MEQPPPPFGDEVSQSQTNLDARAWHDDVDPETESAQLGSMDGGGEWDRMGPEAVRMALVEVVMVVLLWA